MIKDLTDIENDGSGLYAEYYVYGGTGLKVFRRLFTSEESARDSLIWDEAGVELNILRKVANSGITPAPFGVEVIKCNEFYRVAILMEHITGVTACEYFGFPPDDSWDQTPEEFREISEGLANIIREFGVDYSDIHGENVIIGDDGRAYLIDFSPNELYVYE